MATVIPIFGIDIAIIPTSSESGKVFRFNRDSTNRCVKTRGVVFLAQRVALNFLTAKGTDYIEPNRGTDFAAIIGANVSSTEDLAELATLAVMQTQAYIKKVQASESSLKKDEILSSISLISVSIGDSSIEISIAVKSLTAAATAVLQLPSN